MRAPERNNGAPIKRQFRPESVIMRAKKGHRDKWLMTPDSTKCLYLYDGLFLLSFIGNEKQNASPLNRRNNQPLSLSLSSFLIFSLLLPLSHSHTLWFFFAMRDRILVLSHTHLMEIFCPRFLCPSRRGPSSTSGDVSVKKSLALSHPRTSLFAGINQSGGFIF